MESNPRDYGEQCRFDAFCKKVLRNEARAYLRNMKRQREREAFFSDLSQAELDKLCVMDRYPSDSIVFSSHGYDLHIDNEFVAEAFATLPQMEQSILILHCTLDLADGEIGNLVGMSRSAVQRHRTKALQELHELGIRTVMVTGDNRRTAEAVGRAVGIDEVVAEVLPDGKVELVVNGEHQQYADCEQALVNAAGKYVVKSISARADTLVIELTDHSVVQNDLNADWVKDQEKETGEAISFF